MKMKIEIKEQAFDPWQEITAYQKQTFRPGEYGATSIFIGSMRDMNDGFELSDMTLEFYPEMTQKHIEQIVDTAMQKWEILDAFILHRVGQVFPSDPIVCVAVWSEHRAAAYDANRFIMEDLKSNAPFWKKESTENKDRWVEKNTPG